jgi:hypothetical protein
MTDVAQLLQRQASWQRTRASLPWPEKIRMAESVRLSAERLRAAPRERIPATPPPPGAAS